MSFPFTAELTVEEYLHGVRIDRFLVRHFRNYTPYRMQRLVRAGQVRIEGVPATTGDRVFQGQQISIRLLEPPDYLFPSEPLPLNILYEDPWLIVVNKPAGLVVHPCGRHLTGSLANALQAHFDTQTQLRGLVRPGVVHRLDRLTSGVMVCTKEHLAHRRLSIHFQESRVSKAYLALVHGIVEPDQGEVRLHIGQTPGPKTIRMSTAPDAVAPKAACTRFEVLERFDGYSLVKASPVTGRLHQIRVHMAGIGHPIVADEFYSPSAELWAAELPQSGAGEALSDETDRALLTRQALHASELRFVHPIGREVMTFEAPLATDMAEVLRRLQGVPAVASV